MSQQQIIAETGLSERAVKYAIKLLVISGVVKEFNLVDDLRQKRYVMEGK